MSVTKLLGQCEFVVQVQHSRLQSGEERQLRATLRQLESRRSSVERAGLVHLAVMGEGGIGGVLQGVRALEGHVNAILAQEEAHAGLSAAGKFVFCLLHVVLALGMVSEGGKYVCMCECASVHVCAAMGT